MEASSPAPDKTSVPSDKPAETGEKTRLTGAMVRAGRCKKILEHLSKFDPDDFFDYNDGLKPVEDKYEITTDGYSALESAVRAMRKANTVNA